MANPNVRPHLTFFPEDKATQFSNAYQGERWLKWMDPDLLSPMVREKGQDFYVFKPTMLIDRTICVPFRWFMRSGVMHGCVWRMIESDCAVSEGWIVVEYDTLDIAVTELATSFPYLLGSFNVRNILDPRMILGIKLT